MDVETFALCALGMPEVQLAAASREAALGRIFNCQMDLQLKGPETKARSTTAVIGTESFNPSLFHLVNMCLSLIDAAPMLETSLLDIRYGLRREPQNGLSLAQQKKQLAVIDALVAQTAMSCTAGEVKALEQQIGYALPVAYKEFLTWMGHGAGSFLRYLDCFYPSLAPLQQTAHAMLTTDACRSTLADDAFVFTLISGEDLPLYELPKAMIHWYMLIEEYGEMCRLEKSIIASAISLLFSLVSIQNCVVQGYFRVFPVWN